MTQYSWRLRQQKIVEGLRYWKTARPEAYDHNDLYFFIDYICLPQFRRCAAEEEQFQKAMSHMHLLYAALKNLDGKCCAVIRIFFEGSEFQVWLIVPSEIQRALRPDIVWAFKYRDPLRQSILKALLTWPPLIPNRTFLQSEANSAAPFCKIVWRLEKLTPSALMRQHPGRTIFKLEF